MSWMSSFWDWIWIVWLVITAISFGILEGIALTDKRTGNTLSDHVWVFLGINRDGIHRTPSGKLRFFRFLFCAGIMWVVVHFVTGGWM